MGPWGRAGAGADASCARAEGVLLVGVRVVAALGEEALLRLVRAAGGGVETELVAVLALLLELGDVTADDDDDVW